MSMIVRVVMLLAAPITALLVARESLQFGLIQTFVAIILIVLVVGAATVGPMLWRAIRPGQDQG